MYAKASTESDAEQEEKNDKNAPKYWQTSETTIVRWLVKICGFCSCLILLLWITSYLLTLIVVGEGDTLPAYARSILWLSIGHHLEEFSPAPSPPPDFRR